MVQLWNRNEPNTAAKAAFIWKSSRKQTNKQESNHPVCRPPASRLWFKLTFLRSDSDIVLFAASCLIISLLYYQGIVPNANFSSQNKPGGKWVQGEHPNCD